MSAAGVFTPDYRFTFVKMVSGTDVGDGTAYPLKVTVDELAEIMYRVKDAWFTAGQSAIEYVDEGDTATSYIEIVAGVPDDHLVYTYVGSIVRRGYWKSADDVSPYADPYFQELYTAEDGNDYRDVGDNERAMWLDSFRTDGFLATGFSQYLVQINEGDLDYGILSQYYVEPTLSDKGSAFLQLSILDTVAWMDNTGSHNPFDPGNELYVGLSLLATGTFGLFNEITTNQNEGALLPKSATSLKLIFELASSSPSCALYAPSDSAVTGVTGTDFTITAQEWWPYAKFSPPTDVWDSGTGAKL